MTYNSLDFTHSNVPITEIIPNELYNARPTSPNSYLSLKSVTVAIVSIQRVRIHLS